MEDHRLRSYCLIVETRSFSKAAQAKHMTQSAMSRLVKSLEDELGVTLLHRKGKAVVPTGEGRLLYDHSKKILDEYGRLEQSVSSAAASAKSALRLGASRTPAVHLLPQLLYDFSKAHPQIRIDLSICRTASVLRDLRDGKIDIGIVESAVTDGRFAVVPLADDELILIAPENHPLARRKGIPLAELVAEPLILPESGSAEREQVDACFRGAGIDIRRLRTRMALGSPELIVHMVRAGLGIALVSKWAAFSAVKEGSVKVLRSPLKNLQRTFAIVSDAAATPPPAAVLFREFLGSHKLFIPF
jgi:DNA-binding transcriptional LysR family regulator